MGTTESSEHSSTNFCAFCLSTITEYSKSHLLVLTSTKALSQSQHSYVKLCGHLEAYYGDFWAYLSQLFLGIYFCDGNGWVWTIRIVLSADTVDLRSVVPIL